MTVSVTGLALPGAGVALRVHLEMAALELLGFRFLLRRGFLGIGPAQDRLDPLDQQPLRERLPDEVVGAHLEAEQFVDLVILRGEEDHRQVGFLAQAAQQLHPVHARHLDVENREIGRACLQPVEGRRTIGIGLDPIALGLEAQGDGGQNVPVVIDKGYGRHGGSSCWRPLSARDE